MKVFVGFFVALAAISFVAASADPNPVPPPPAPPAPLPVKRIQLGTLLKPCVIAVAEQVVKFISGQITALVPGTTPGKLVHGNLPKFIKH